MTDDFLREENRAEDILLGALGYGEDARIVSIEKSEHGYRGSGCFSDGESFEFCADWELEELEKWALEVMIKALSIKKKKGG